MAEKNYVLQGDYTQHVVVRVQANSLEEAVAKAEACHGQVVDFCPDLYCSFEWDGDEESVEEFEFSEIG